MAQSEKAPARQTERKAEGRIHPSQTKAPTKVPTKAPTKAPTTAQLQDAQLQRRRADQRAVAAERISEELQQDLNSAEEQIRSLKAQLSQAVLVQGTAEVSAEGASKLVNELENSISTKAHEGIGNLSEIDCVRHMCHAPSYQRPSVLSERCWRLLEEVF